MPSQNTLPRPDSALRNSPLLRRARREVTTVVTALADRLRLAVAAALTLTAAAVAATTGGAFALAALVGGLEQVLPTWAAYAATAALLLTGAAIAAGLGAWTIRVALRRFGSVSRGLAEFRSRNRRAR